MVWQTVLTFFFTVQLTPSTALHLQALQRLKWFMLIASLFHHAPLFIVFNWISNVTVQSDSHLPRTMTSLSTDQQVKLGYLGAGKGGSPVRWRMGRKKVDAEGIVWSLPLIHLASSKFFLFIGIVWLQYCIVSEMQVHKKTRKCTIKVLENEDLRVMEVQFRPGAEI